ncbi:MAG: ion channel [Mariniphaga sp.]
MGTIYLTAGIILLALAMYDFFFTTLSGGGAAFITRFVTFISHKSLQLCVKLFGRSVYKFSGMAINLSVLLVWVVLIWIGLYLVFSSDPIGIVNDKGRMANNWERLYYTGYTLSTLGMGNFSPTTPVFEMLTSIFSFFGFIFFTTSMTYLISVSSAVIHKRSLALAIRNLGKNPEEMVYRLLNQDITLSRMNLSSLQDKIERHSVNLQAYPVLHNFANSQIPGSLSLNLVTLDEALSILLNSKEGEKMKNALTSIRSSLTYFLNHIDENFSRTLHKEAGPDVHKLPGWEIISSSYINDPNLYYRRKILGGLLKSESFEWQDVYNTKSSAESN